MPSLELPRLRADQYRIAVHPAKRKECAMGRRWGKTVLGGVLMMNVLRQHGKCAWVVPTYKNGRSLWRWVQRTAAPMAAAKMWDVSRSERTVTTHLGGFFGIYSDDNIDAIRSEDFDLVINDEASRIGEESISDAIEPTLADRDGELINISTPRGRNWWWRECVKAKADGTNHAFFTAPSADNPNPNIQKAARMAKERVSERAYRQEWLAEFIEDGAGVFRNVRACVGTADRSAQACVIGVDWGRTDDATVFVAVDPATRGVVALERLTRVEFAHQRAALLAFWQRHGRGPVIAEANSIGQPNIEALVRDGIPVQPFVTTNATKAQIIDALVLAFEQQAITLLPDEWLLGELEAYESERLPSGLLRYSAPEGMHDDGVMALALAWSGVNHGISSIMQHYAARAAALKAAQP